MPNSKTTADASHNPFRYGALALDDSFTDREEEVSELTQDALNGQDVVIFAPRRYGKSSLIWKVSQELLSRRALVAQVNLMTTPTIDRLADKLARTLYDDIASPLFRAKERLSVFQGLRVRPIVTVDPNDGSISFSFDSAVRRQDMHATIERLLELLGQLAGERKRSVVLILDEFQEIADIDPDLPRLMRSVFQEQPEVAHIYLGSKRHMMQRIFNDQNEPFWRSAKQLELGTIPREPFSQFVTDGFRRTARAVEPAAVERILDITGGHPYATQELCYFTWQDTGSGETATVESVESALEGVLNSEHAHFTLVWERASSHQRLLLGALSREPGHPLSSDYRHRHGLPSPSSVQRALEALEQAELAGRERGRWWICEPFLATWLLRNS
jgi:hypothetical protein